MLLLANKNKTAQRRFVQVLEIFYLLLGGAGDSMDAEDGIAPSSVMRSMMAVNHRSRPKQNKHSLLKKTTANAIVRPCGKN